MTGTFELTRCTVVTRSARDCNGRVPEGAEIPLCLDHMREAYLWYASQLRALRDAGRLSDRDGEDLAAAETPDTYTLREHREPVVYYVRIGHYIKIGTTVDLHSRMASLMPDEFLALEPGGRDVEAQRHRQFEWHRAPKGKEYFLPTVAVMEHIEALRAAGWKPTEPPAAFPGSVGDPCAACGLLALWSDDGRSAACRSCGAKTTVGPVRVPAPGASKPI